MERSMAFDKKKIFRRHLFDLTPFDFEAYPVWENHLEFEVEDGDELIYLPVKETPIKTLMHRVVGVPIQLANGKYVWGQLHGIRLGLPRTSEEFLSISVEKGGKWFHLHRYFDPGRDRLGPEALAKFLDMRVDDVFPIKYDLRPYVSGDCPSLAGLIPKEPRERLTKEERRKLPRRTPQQEIEFLEQLVEVARKMPRHTPEEEAQCRVMEENALERLAKIRDQLEE